MAELETKTEDKKRIIENEVLTIKKIIVITDKEGNIVKQIRFKLDNKQEITTKLKEKKEDLAKHRGLSISKQYSENILVDNLPEKLFFWNEILNDNGELHLLATWTEWYTKDFESKDITYRFFSNEQFDLTYAIDEDNKEIKEPDKKSKK